jgi:adenylate cyclase
LQLPNPTRAELRRGWYAKVLKPIQIGTAASIAAALTLFMLPPAVLGPQRELYFDAMTQWSAHATDPRIVVADIDRKALASVSGSTWSRSDTAKLIGKIAEARPAVIAVDLVFSTDCDTERQDNRDLAAALEKAPSVLGFLLSDRAGEAPEPSPPLIAAKGLQVPELWFIDGAEAACPAFAAKAESAAGSFLFGDADARVRRVQAYSIYKGLAYPTLAIEAVRIADGPASPPILAGNALRLKLGARTLNLSENGNLRFSASRQSTIDERSVSAADILSGAADAGRLTGKIVFIGSSLPNLGGLRSSASMPLEPDVQIHADLASGILQQTLPWRDRRIVRYEALYALAAGIAIALAAARLGAFGIASFGAAMIVATLTVCGLAYASTGILIDGFSIALALAFVLSVTTYVQFARARTSESRARARFGQYLPKSVVERYLDGGNTARMAGEKREVTALFTDIEGFSPLSGIVATDALVKLLDVYFSEVNALVASHGGMVDKVVGDAVHAFFNAPDDLDDHVNRAIASACAIHKLTEEIRNRAAFSACGFGRTRIGLETGPAVLGEVGAGGKLDYTAHGPAINLAARLQEANKTLGTSICIGPAAAAMANRPLRPLGEHDIRGFGTLPLFTIEA